MVPICRDVKCSFLPGTRVYKAFLSKIKMQLNNFKITFESVGNAQVSVVMSMRSHVIDGSVILFSPSERVLKNFTEKRK